MADLGSRTDNREYGAGSSGEGWKLRSQSTSNERRRTRRNGKGMMMERGRMEIEVQNTGIERKRSRRIVKTTMMGRGMKIVVGDGGARG